MPTDEYRMASGVRLTQPRHLPPTQPSPRRGIAQSLASALLNASIACWIAARVAGVFASGFSIAKS